MHAYINPNIIFCMTIIFCWQHIIICLRCYIITVNSLLTCFLRKGFERVNYQFMHQPYPTKRFPWYDPKLSFIRSDDSDHDHGKCAYNPTSTISSSSSCRSRRPTSRLSGLNVIGDNYWCYRLVLHAWILSVSREVVRPVHWHQYDQKVLCFSLTRVVFFTKLWK